jgi:hypothetical protein
VLGLSRLQSCSLLALGLVLLAAGSSYITPGVIVPPGARLQEPGGWQYSKKPGNADIGSSQNLAVPVDHGCVKSGSDLDSLVTTMVRAGPRLLSANFLQQVGF